MREEMGRAAVEAAEAVGYDNVGTVEFLVQDDEFYFLEMNTRVQVEHPVTEEVTGIDIVQTGIRIAAGEELPFSQEDVTWRGHAIEVRLNAEDAATDFVPSPGAVDGLRGAGRAGRPGGLVAQGPGVVPESYDPLFAKLIVRGPDRAGRPAAAGAGARGVQGRGHRHDAALLPRPSSTTRSSPPATTRRASSPRGWAASTIESAQTAGHGAPEEKIVPRGRGRGQRQALPGEGLRRRGRGGRGRGATAAATERTTRRTAAAEGAIAAPMQGTIVKVLVEVGQEVAADDAVCLLEAMKMESEVRAQTGGRVSEVLVEAGKTVRSGEPLVVLE